MTRSRDAGATVLITHRLREDKHADYERWASEIAARSMSAPGHLDWHMARPIPGLTDMYTVVLRFDTMAHLREWMSSATRKRLIEKVQSLFADGEEFFISSGLDFWFMSQASAKAPVRWKQFLVTWSAIYPLVLGVPLAVAPVLGRLGISGSPSLTTLLVTGLTVFLMVYVVMPRYAKLLHRWLFR